MSIRDVTSGPDSPAAKRVPSVVSRYRLCSMSLERGLAVLGCFSPGRVWGIAPVRDDTGSVIAALAIEAHTAAVTPEELVRDAGPRLTSAAGSLT